MFREILITLLVSMAFSLNAFSEVDDIDDVEDQNYWRLTETSNHWLDLNRLRFTNRASCAKDSRRPTESTFILVDNLNLGRSLLRLSKRIGKNGEFTKNGVYRFRYTVTALTKLIAQELMHGELPLLPTGPESTFLPTYSNILKECAKEVGHCAQLDDYIRKIWETRKGQGHSNIDNFTGVQFLTKSPEPRTSCHYLKQFSPLEAHLYGTKPDVDTLEEIAKTVHKNGDYLTSCDDFNSQTDLKQAIYQLDLRFLNSEEWEKKGFHFWHSLKIYLSWAFRESDEAMQMAYPYGEFFKNIDLEESIYFFSNGCHSLELPECSRESLSINSLRFLAQSADRKELAQLDMFSYTPQGPSSDIVRNDRPDVNLDILDFAEFESGDAWASNFRENLERSRGFVKLKLSKAITSLNLVQEFLGVQKILNDLEKQKNRLISNGMNSEEDAIYRQELYYLCSEFRVAMDEKLSFLRKDLEFLRQQTTINSISTSLTNKDLNQLISYTSELSNAVINHCDSLEKSKIWSEPFIVDKKGLAPWYQEFARINQNVAPHDLSNDLVKHRVPLLTLKDKKNVICISGAHCARKSLSALIDISASLQYIEGLLNLSGKIKSPDLVNPYAERVACRAYDPWGKTKSTIFDFLQNIGMAAVSAYVPTPIYVDVKLANRKVISFNQMVKDGNVYFDPKFDKRKIQATLVADFGPLLSTPCMVTVSGDPNARPTGYLYLDGITTQACHQRENNNVNAYGPADVQSNDSNVTACVSCTISLVNIASTASTYNPAIRPLFFLLKGVVGLVSNLKDPHNFPRSWEVDPNRLYSSYRKFGFIPKSCARRIRDDKSCLKAYCETNIVETFESNFKKYVSDVTIIKGGKSKIWINGCDEPVLANIPYFGCATTKLQKKDFEIPSSCKHLFEAK